MEQMRQGWIRLYRSLLEHPLWLAGSPEQKTVMITLLLLANHREKQWLWQGRPYACKPGQMITSLASIAERCGKGVSRQNVRTALKKLEAFGFLTHHPTHELSLITIRKWDTYQNDKSDGHTQTNQPLTDHQPTSNQPSTHNKNEKNEKNTESPLGRPSLDDVQRYISENKLSVDAGRFWRYYEALGWRLGRSPILRWQPLVHRWDKKESPMSKKKSPTVCVVCGKPATCTENGKWICDIYSDCCAKLRNIAPQVWAEYVEKSRAAEREAERRRQDEKNKPVNPQFLAELEKIHGHIPKL